MYVDTKTIAQLVEWCQTTDMLVICRNSLIPPLPINAIANNIHPLARIVCKCNLSFVRIEQMGNPTACLCIDFPHPLEPFCSQTTLPPFFLHTFLHRFYDTIRNRTKGTSIEVDT